MSYSYENESNLLLNHGGIEKNDLIKQLNKNINSDDNEHNFFSQQSKYYNIESFMKSLTKHNESFSILSLNIGGMKSNFPEFEVFMNTMNELNLDLTIIFLQETHLSEEEMNLYNLEGYALIARNPSVSEFGGLACYVK